MKPKQHDVHNDQPSSGNPDWREVDAIFTALLDVPDHERAMRLTDVCGGDEYLRKAVQRLLNAEQQSRGVFESAALSIERQLDEAAEHQTPEETDVPSHLRRLGSYRLVRLLGRGGMSSVWLAERDDGQFQKTAAIKLLRHWMDDDHAVRRFVAERQILSSLSHPNIAQLLDGGTTGDGTPWLATEYVEGETLTRHCDQHGLDIEARLDLFLQVADAVHYAHQQLVVHRDLKPSNIMVDKQGRVRLLDFGIAKLLETDSANGKAPLTRTGYRPMTPEYAAPEQLAGMPITTATDVYQLGMVLYQLLCGERPANGMSRSITTRTSAAPSKPSTVLSRSTADGRHDASRRRKAGRLKGDLDVIVMKALQELPEHRYSSVAALADDLRNHLRGRGISARADSMLDIMRRFRRRNPLGAAAVTLAIVAIIGLLVTLQVSASRIAHERDAAQREAARATQAKELLLGLFRQANPLAEDALRGRETTIWDSVEASTARVRAELTDDPELRAEMLMTLAMLHHYAGHGEEGAELLEEVVALHRVQDGHDSAAYAVALAELGRHWSLLGRVDEGLAAINEALGIARQLPRGSETMRVPVLLDAAETYRRFDSLETAEAIYREAQALIDAGAPIGLPERLAVGNGLSETLASLGQASESEAMALASIEIVERELGTEHVRLIVPLATLGSAQRELGRPDDSVATISRGLAIIEREFGSGYSSTRSMRNNLMVSLAAAGQPARAAAEMRVLLQQLRQAHGDVHPEVGNALQNLSVMLVLAGEHDEALGVLEQARAVYAASMPSRHIYNAFPLLTQAHIRLLRDDGETAEEVAAEALEILGNALPEAHFAIGIAKCLLGEAWMLQGKLQEAAGLLSSALPIAAAGPQNMLPYVANCQDAQASAAVAIGAPDTMAAP